LGKDKRNRSRKCPQSSTPNKSFRGKSSGGGLGGFQRKKEVRGAGNDLDEEDLLSLVLRGGRDREKEAGRQTIKDSLTIPQNFWELLSSSEGEGKGGCDETPAIPVKKTNYGG